MDDGAILLADRYFPRGRECAPTVLVRSPYGRRGLFVIARGLRHFAERGYQVLVQSCRGTGGSGGEFSHLHQEGSDGLATVAWLRQQPWFNGDLFTYGPSYLGCAHWALDSACGPELKGSVALMTTARFRDQLFPGGGFQLEGWLWWMSMMRGGERGAAFSSLVSQVASAAPWLNPSPLHFKLPLGKLDRVALGRSVTWWQDWLRRADIDAQWWQDIDFRGRVAEGSAPVLFICGWHDLFLQAQLRDFAAVVDAGRPARLVVGPWSHFSTGWNGVGISEALSWMASRDDAPEAGSRRCLVRLFVGGADQWRNFESWPPEGARAMQWLLTAGGGLAANATQQVCAPSTYIYDPAKPTPAVGGARLTRQAGVRDNRGIERRRDVLSFTSAPLSEDLEVIGPLKATLWVASDAKSADYFVRLCSVAPSGRSTNISDGLLRVTAAQPIGADEPRKIEIELYPVAHRFCTGDRLRLQVSSGAHPRYARNLGYAEPLHSATAMRRSRQSIFHDAARPSHVELPVVGLRAASGAITWPEITT